VLSRQGIRVWYSSAAMRASRVLWGAVVATATACGPSNQEMQGAQLPEPLAPNEVVGMRMRPEPVYLNPVIANLRRVLTYPAE